MQTPDATDPRTPLWMVGAAFVLALLTEVVLRPSPLPLPRRRPAVPSCCPHAGLPPMPGGGRDE